MILTIFYQIDPAKRMTLAKALEKLNEFGEFLTFTEKFESFGNLTDVDIPHNTQKSIDMTKLENLTNLTKSSDNLSGNRTYFHNQKESQLCHSFAAVSALRQALLKFLKNFATNEKLATIENEIEKLDGKYSFKIFLVNFVGNVNPRSYQGLMNSADQTSTESQTAVVETVLGRMVKRTTFEIEGWKRIWAIREIFNELNLEIDNYKMKMEKVESDKFVV